MVSFLVDTNVLSELRKGKRCDPGVKRWFGALAEDAIYLSALTIGEIRRGIESIRRRDAPSAAVLEAWLQLLLNSHGDRILPVDRRVAEEWGRTNVPDPMPVVDGLIAATAKVHGLTVATRNVEDMAASGVSLSNPFAVRRKPQAGGRKPRSQ